MVLQKRLDYGFNGYQVPPTPRATRSARKRRIVRSNADDNQMCAFDLLATVAGKLLLEGKEKAEIVKDSVKKEQCTEDKPLDAKSIDHGVCDQSFFVSEHVLQAPLLNKCSKEPPVAHHNACSGPTSAITSSASCKLEVDDNTRLMKIEPFSNEKVSDRNASDMRGSDHSVKFLSCRDHIPCGSFSVNREDVKLVTRDDDENSGCTQPSTENKAIGPLPGNGDRRIKTLVKNDEQCNADNLCHSLKNGYKSQRSLRDYPFKKRRLYEYSSPSNIDGSSNREGICSSHGKCSGDIFAPVGTLQGVTGWSMTSTAVECASFQSRDPHVKLKIKSFRVPELFIEIPETATIGSLKRTVMEAVTAILGGGLHVGVLLQGKKIRDDNKTLLQTGISCDNNPDALGFILEPNSSQAPATLCSEAHPFLLPCDTPQPLERYRAGRNLVHHAVQYESSNILLDPQAHNFSNFIESDHDSAPSPPDMSHEQKSVDSRALVVVPSMNAEALNVTPMRKSKKSESAQRRIRRPFSVSEVEALVQAVEKLGTGRWRDVKLRAFDTAKHRTYVDLKDKWKTLVHTARISPQQRRGEPVPQELLDRVLMAHAYWSQQQVKQQLKQHSEACLLL